jgi:hypothetical protein
MLAILHDAAAALRRDMEQRNVASIPLEQVENELALVLHIEIAALLARAGALGTAPRTSSDGSDGEVELERELQRDARETIGVARSCGVVVPRVVLRIVAGGRATWPHTGRFAAWARRMDPSGSRVQADAS